MSFGAAKFQVDVKERGRGGGSDLNVQWGKSEYVDSPYRCDYNNKLNSFFPRWKWE